MSVNKLLLIAGGCFPFQDNIPPQGLYHQILKEKVLKQQDIELELTLIRYEKLGNCVDLIKEESLKEKPDYILFHLRVEPIFRYIKFLYRYHNRKNIYKSTLNIAAFGIHNLKLHQRQDSTDIDKITYSSRKSSDLHKVLREFNYALGLLSGNVRYSFRLYLKVLLELRKFCNEEDIVLIVTSPASRPFSFFENLISYRLFKYITSQKSLHDIIFVNGLGLKDPNGVNLFCEDKIRVNERGHERFAELISRRLGG